MSDPNAPQDPFAAGREPEPPGSTNQPPAYPSQPPPYGAQPPQQPPAYGQQPPAYGQQPPQAPPYGSQPPPPYGAQPGGYYGQPAFAYPKNSLGIWSLVLGIVGVVLSCGFLSGIPAIIVGGRAKRAVAEGQANNGGMATAGIIIGWIATIGSLLLLAGLVVLAATGNWTNAFDSTDFPRSGY